MPVHRTSHCRYLCGLLWLLGFPLGAARLPAAAVVPPTPMELPGAETHLYRAAGAETGPAMRLFVVKPEGWTAGDHRAALVFFFGGGWTRGTPEKSIGWARAVAKLGLVGIAPDYRTRERFDSSPLESVADGRAALRWVQEHAAELGIDGQRIAVGGSSAGGHVALWTAITTSPPGSAATEAPLAQPAALVLFSAVSDTSMLSGYTPKRFGDHATDLSPLHQLDAHMPPVLAFHGDADPLVPLSQAEALRDALVAHGNTCELFIVPGGGHNFSGDVPAWKERSRELTFAFLRAHGLVDP